MYFFAIKRFNSALVSSVELRNNIKNNSYIDNNKILKKLIKKELML